MGADATCCWRFSQQAWLCLLFVRGGAYYIMTDIAHFDRGDDVEFARWLVEEVGVAVVPGSSFYHEPCPGADQGSVLFLQEG